MRLKIISDGKKGTRSLPSTLFSFCIVSFFFTLTIATGQDTTFSRQFRDQFEKFKESTQKEHADFQTMIDSIFLAQSDQNWVRFNAFYDQLKGRPKPAMQPVAHQEKVIDVRDSTLIKPEKVIDVRDSALIKPEKVIEVRDSALIKPEKVIEVRDSALIKPQASKKVDNPPGYSDTTIETTNKTAGEEVFDTTIEGTKQPADREVIDTTIETTDKTVDGKVIGTTIETTDKTADGKIIDTNQGKGTDSISDKNVNEVDETDKPAPPIDTEGDSIWLVEQDPSPSLNSLGVKQEDVIFVDFIGQKIGISQARDTVGITRCDVSSIKRFYLNYIKNSTLNKIARELAILTDIKKMNDWGYLFLLDQVAGQIYRNDNERVLFTWISLMRNGYDARIAYDADQIYLLANFEQNLYNTKYVKINGRQYYLIPLGDQQIIGNGFTSYDTHYPSAIKKLDLEMDQLPVLANNPTMRALVYQADTLNIRLNLNLMQYLGRYPQCDLPVYFNTPLSPAIVTKIKSDLQKAMSGKTVQEKVETLLHFVQESFPYKNDFEQFGNENYLFPDESLYYPAIDCEDRSVLFAKLVKEYTGLACIGLDYPEHVAVAVALPGYGTGDFVLYDEKRYYICDPTYIGASCGEAMPEYKNIEPRVIEIKN